jgi:hypothetical protein
MTTSREAKAPWLVEFVAVNALTGSVLMAVVTVLAGVTAKPSGPRPR